MHGEEMNGCCRFSRFFVGLWLFAAPVNAAYDPQHTTWNELLKAHVRSGVVDYVGFKKESAKVDVYLAQLGEVPAVAYEAFPRDEKIAYLINAYNAITVRMITDFYPVKSIQSIGETVGGSFFNRKTKQWKVQGYQLGQRTVTFRAMGKPISLDEIEHDELRAKFKEPRVHFALVCGAVSCPFLRSEAYTRQKLNAQLNAQGKDFLADSFHNRYDEETKTLYLSKIFDWFSEDFKREGGVLSFVMKYLASERVALLPESPEIKFLDYDWSLNSETSTSAKAKGAR